MLYHRKLKLYHKWIYQRLVLGFVVASILLISVAECNKLEPCHQNPCRNGGSCMKSGDTLANTFCPSGFTAYQKSCYNFVQNPASWSDAQRHCNSMQAILTTVESQREREFIQAYLKQNLGEQDALSDACIAVTATSDYLNWAAENCEYKRNFYICETAEAEPGDYTGNYFYQCRCQGGFSGINCEISPPPNQPVQPSQRMICESDQFQHSCPNKDGSAQTIAVDYAAYGRPTNKQPLTCVGAPGEIDCVADNSLLLMMQRCQGLQSCQLPVLNQVFTTNPCLPGTLNYMEYRFRCEKGKQQCPKGTIYFRKTRRCYKIEFRESRARRRSWEDARSACTSAGGDLAGPIDADVHEFLVSKLVAESDKPDDRKVKYFWIGLKSINTAAGVEGVWNSGANMDFKPSQSRVTEENKCVSYYVQPSRGPRPSRVVWLAKNCNLFYNWICEFASFNTERPKLYDPSWNATTVGVPKPTTQPAITQRPATQRPTTMFVPQTTPTTTTLRTPPPLLPRRSTVGITISYIQGPLATSKSSSTASTPSTTTSTPTSTTSTTSSTTSTSTSTTSTPSTTTTTTTTTTPVTSTTSTLPPTTTTTTTTTPMPTTTPTTTPTTEPATERRTTEKSVQPQTTAAPTFPPITRESRPALETRAPIMGPSICKATRAKGLHWRDTREGTMVTIPCPPGTLGEARWFCKRAGNLVQFSPKSPDLSDCKHPWVEDLERQLVRKRHAMLISSDLNQRLKETQQLYGGDIAGSLDVIGKMIPLQKSQLLILTRQLTPRSRADEAENFTKEIASTSNFLMTQEQLKVWDDFPNQRRHEEVSKLMQNLELGAEMLTHFLGEKNTRSFQFDNLAMKVSVYRGLQQKAQVQDQRQFHRKLRFSDSTDSAEQPDFAPTLGDGLPEIELPTIGILRSAVVDTMPVVVHPVGSSPDDPVISSSVDEPLAVRLGYFLFTNIRQLLKPENELASPEPESDELSGRIVNSHVIGASVNDPRMSLQLPKGENVTLKMFHIHKEGVTNPKCVYWDTSFNRWDPRGCSIVNTTEEWTLCTCNHLTSFAVLMDVEGNLDKLPDLHQQILKYLTMVGCGLSAICLFICVLVFTFFRSLWCDRNTIHRNLCICLLIAELLFLFGIDRTGSESSQIVPIWCTAIAGLLHYFFLAAFCWMLAEGYQLYLMLIKVFEPEKSRIIWYYILAYGFPAVVVSVSMGLRLQDYGTKNYCWIDVKTPTIYAFIGPISLVILANIIFLCVALKVVFSLKSVHERSRLDKMRGWLKGSTMLLCLLGVTWVFGYFFVIDPAALYFAYIFTILNCLQGVFIFAFHVVLNEKVHSVLFRCCRKSCKSCFPDKYDTSGFNSSSGTGSSGAQKRLMEASGHTNSTFSTMVVSTSRDWVFAGQNGSLIIPTGDDQGSSDSGTPPNPSPTERQGSGLRLRNAIVGIVPDALRKSGRGGEKPGSDVPAFPERYVNSEVSYKSTKDIPNGAISNSSSFSFVSRFYKPPEPARTPTQPIETVQETENDSDEAKKSVPGPHLCSKNCIHAKRNWPPLENVSHRNNEGDRLIGKNEKTENSKPPIGGADAGKNPFVTVIQAGQTPRGKIAYSNPSFVGHF